MTLGKRLKELRTQSGFSQEMVAERIGVSRQAVTKWESGRTIPTAENLAALAQLYQVPLTPLNADRSAWVRDGEDNPMLRENKTVIALSAQLGSLYACSGTLRGLLDGEGLPGDQLPPLVGNIILLVLCSMWTVWNLSFEPELERRRKNMTIELRYMLAQLILAGLSVWRLGLAGFAVSLAGLCFYLAVINPKYMGRNLWWTGTRPKSGRDKK